MKNLLFFACSVFSIKGFAQVPVAMPDDAYAFYNNAMPVLRPQIKNIILQTANALKNRRPNADSLKKRLNTNAALKDMSNNDIDGITILVMVQASKETDADLKQMVLGTMKTVSASKSEYNNVSIEEINERKQMKLQKIMDRKSDISQETNNVMKNITGNPESIINNLK